MRFKSYCCLTPGGQAQYEMPRTYTPQASATLPPHWAEDLHDMYAAEGFRCAVAWADETETAARLTVQGLKQRELDCHINDPLGKLGEQDPRHPNTGTHQRLVGLIDSEQCLIPERPLRLLTRTKGKPQG